MRVIVLVGCLMAMAGTVCAAEMPTDDWLKQVAPQMPQAVCNEGQGGRKCFKVTQAECTAAVLKLSEPCVKQLRPQMPAKVKEEDASMWGNKLGTCVGQAYGNQFAAKRVKSPECGG